MEDKCKRTQIEPLAPPLAPTRLLLLRPSANSLVLQHRNPLRVSLDLTDDLLAADPARAPVRPTRTALSTAPFLRRRCGR
jgi:hypothetical protein